MADYATLSDDALAAAYEGLKSRASEHGTAARREMAAVAEETQRRLRQRYLAQREAAASEAASYADAYRSRLGEIEQGVRQWRAPPHPRPDEAFAAEESPQLANSFEWRLWNKPMVKTRAMWERDSRAAELARRLQAERKLAQEAGPAQLAAFDSVYPGVDLVDTSVSDSWRVGLEPWGMVNKVLSYPSAWPGMFAAGGQLAAGSALEAAGSPNYAADDRNNISWQQVNAADDVLFNLPTKLAYMATGDRDYAPAYARSYWDEVRKREQAPLSVLRPGASLPSPRNVSGDAGAAVFDVTGDLLKGTGMSDTAKLAVQVPAMILAGTLTDPFMPRYGASLLRNAALLGGDVAAGGAIVGAIPIGQAIATSQSDRERMGVEQYYDNLLRALQQQNRITP